MRIQQKTLAAMLIALSVSACAAGDNDNKAMEGLKAEIAKKLSKSEIKSIKPTPVKGIYEVVIAPKQVVYLDAKADYMFVGDLVDVKKRQSLTETRLAELNRTDFNKLPLEHAFKLVRGDGSRKAAVFTDPDCPYCKKLEKEVINRLDNATIYTFLLPLTQLHPDATRKSQIVWCAGEKERQKIWWDWMLEGKELKGDSSCANPIEKIAQVAAELDISGTPAIVFESGEIVPGAIPKELFEEKLSAKNGGQKAAKKGDEKAAVKPAQ